MLTAGVAVWRAWQAAGGADAGRRRRPQPRRIHGAGRRRRARVSPTRCRWCAFARRRCRRRCRPASARWRRSSALDDGAVASACREAAQGAGGRSRSTSTRPGRLVIAGHKEAVERAIAARQGAGAKRGVLLPVSAPFHSSLMKPRPSGSRERLARRRRSRRRRSRCVHNVDVAEHREPDAIRDALARQAASPVRWTRRSRRSRRAA